MRAVVDPSPPIAGKAGGSVSIFGRRLSYDALLLAAASLAGVFVLYKLGQGGQPAIDTSSIDPSAGSAGDFSTVSTQPPQQVTSGGYWGSIPPSGGTVPPIHPAIQVTAGGQPAPAAMVQWQGKEGGGGGPNTTGRSSGPQILVTDAGGGMRAPKPLRSLGPVGGGAPVGGPAGTQNAQGARRSSGGQIFP